MDKEKNELDDRYRELLRKKKEITEEINSIICEACVFRRCGHVLLWKDIDPYTIRREERSTEYDSWADYFVPCNVVDKESKECDWCQKEVEISPEDFDKILEMHGVGFWDYYKGKKKRKK